MVYSTKKGAISMPLALVITLIIFLAIVAVNVLLAGIAKEKYDDTEFLECKFSIDLANGVKQEADIAGLTGSLQPVAIECAPIVIENEVFEKAKDETAIAKTVLDKMRVAWWATGKGEYKNVWNDILRKDEVCKAMYYFRLEDIFEDGEGINKQELIVHLENTKLPVIEASLADYVQASSGLKSKYYLAIENDGIVNDKVYAIMISSSTDGFNAVLLTEMKASPEDTRTFINDNINDNSLGNRVICSKFANYGEKMQRYWIV